jgi:hypothetical protein
VNGRNIFVALDCHVHLYQLGDLPKLLQAAVRNARHVQLHTQETPWRLDGQPVLPTLILTELNSRDSFAVIMKLAMSPGGDSIHGWRFEAGGDGLSIFARHDDGEVALIISGQQIVTKERLEILAIACRPDVENGLELTNTLSEIRHRDAAAVFPWGVGKWLGRRGRLLDAALAAGKPGDFALSDTASRPFCWPEPRLAAAAQRGFMVLRGADPLPLAGQVEHVGAFGTLANIVFDDERPALSVVAALKSDVTAMKAFGSRQSPFAFCRAQLLFRLTRLSR